MESYYCHLFERSRKLTAIFLSYNITGQSFRACSAIFTFVSLDKDRRPQVIPELKVETDAEKVRKELGKKRYIAKKEKRKRNAEVAKLDSSSAIAHPPPAERQMSIN